MRKQSCFITLILALHIYYLFTYCFSVHPRNEENDYNRITRLKKFLHHMFLINEVFLEKNPQGPSVNSRCLCTQRFCLILPCPPTAVNKVDMSPPYKSRSQMKQMHRYMHTHYKYHMVADVDF